MAATGYKNTARQWLVSCCHYQIGWLLLHCYIFSILIPVNGTIGQQLRPGTDLAINNESGICKSVDIRNSIETFERLRGCRVVEGFVQILLFDNVNESLFSNISFPELTEITDYLLLYRVNGLRSLGKLFPNLSVIRGQNPLFTYAFVVFEMSSLQEIALYSLTDITHGLIRIDKNPSLCFVNSIDWDRIAHEKGDHFIRSIKPENECPLCPGEDGSDDTLESHKSDCELAPYKPDSDGLDRRRYLCWNRSHCQKICPKNCIACNDKKECCDSKCLGGCSNERRDVCKVCRNFSIGSGKDQQCMRNCPDGYYEYLGRRCVKYEDCIKMRRPIEYPRTQIEYPYKIFNRSCILQCPTNYMDDYDNHTCIPCDGRCKKECPGTNVDSITAAQQLRGCTHIRGSLEIQIRGGRNIVNELEENLNMIEEIDGYIKIVRSFSLVSLNFLKNLKYIHGEYLESQKYAFVVLDNQNLQNLWDWTNHTLRIDKGRLFFHFNPKLCLYKIERLRQEANLSESTEIEVAQTSNGDKIACNVTELEVQVLKITSKAVILSWNQFRIDDQRKLLGYIVYSIHAPHRNITLYDGRDACGGDGWRVDDVAIPEEYNATLTYLLPVLEPYTQYAYYVKTYTIATERHGAQSNISYFRTLADEPTEPQNLKVVSNDSDSLIISWDPPLKPHGNLTHYIVTGYKHKDSSKEDLLNNRNYCNSNVWESPLSSEKPPPPKIIKNDSCVCDANTKQTGTKKFEENDILSQISFENALHNQVYVKRTLPETRQKRDVTNGGSTHAFPNDYDSHQQQTENHTIKNVTEKGADIWESFNFKVYGKTELYLNKLHHFTQYNIYVQACREKDGVNDIAKQCSTTALKTSRTLKKRNADDIDKIHITNRSTQMVTIAWEEPPDPNGLILTYEIEYKRIGMEMENYKTGECISRKKFSSQTMTYTLKNLHPGNYSLRLQAVSQAGRGNSPYIYFYIEEPQSSMFPQLMIAICLIFVLAIMAFGIYIFWKKKNEAAAQNMKLITQINPEYVSTVYVPDEWEVPRKKIELIKELGQGSFGMVYEGLAKDIQGKPQIRCAIKTVNEHATNRERIEFLNEASVMKAFDTAHVVRLLGVVSQGQPTLVVMELMANGDLKAYLRSHRPDAETYDPSPSRQPPTLKQILQMAIEIADGMSYLAAKKFVHRDLAARNCMVAEELTVKIGDFGMTRDIYETDYYRKGTKGLLPVRWMAPESLKDGVFTSSSDVWSYGVVLWEMATLASQPYQGLSNDQVLRYVIDGGVMERPENCPDKLYMLMRYCWQHKPTARPSFLELCSLLLEDASPTFAQVSFYHSAAGMEARTSRPTPSPSQDDPSTPLRVDLDRSDGESETELDFETDTRMEFPTFMPAVQEGSATVNGYVSGRPTNGTATAQY